MHRLYNTPIYINRTWKSSISEEVGLFSFENFENEQPI